VPGVSVKITNVRCEARCVYCYENALRDAPDQTAERPLKLDAVLAQMEKEWRMSGGGSPPYLHGGEALTAGHKVVETVMKKAYELAGCTNIQTYGYLIDDKYIEIFKKYKATVGISIDGPWPLNKARVVPGMNTRAVTELVHKNILRLRAEGISVSIICMLHKANATKEHLPKLKEWILWLRDIGVTSGRLNLMHTDYHRYGKSLELSEEEAEYAWRELFRWCKVENDGLNWQPFEDAVSSVLGLEQGTCVFGPCLYFHADAEPVVLSDGTTATCLKTGKHGHVYPRLEQWDGDARGFGGIRYEVLPLIPQEYGGCQGCKFWRNCMGGCPSEGIGGDWRNKTRFCRAYYGLFDEAEKYLRRLMPNIRFVSDAERDGATFQGEGVWGMNPPAWRYMDPKYTSRPSSWRSEAISYSQRARVPVKAPNNQGQLGPGWINPFEHIDGDIHHADSDAQPRTAGHGDWHGDETIHSDSHKQPGGRGGHGDWHGDETFHADSGPSKQFEEEQRQRILEELEKVNERIEQLKREHLASKGASKEDAE